MPSRYFPSPHLIGRAIGLKLLSVAIMMVALVTATSTSKAQDCGWGFSLHIEQPAEGAVYTRGDAVDIRWFADHIHPDGNVTTVDIEISSNGGESWDQLASFLQTDLNVWQWNIPTTWSHGSNFFLRISEVPDGVIFTCSPNAAAIVGPFTIERGCFPALISQDLIAQTVCPGEPVVLSVESDAVEPTYQWIRNGRTVAVTTEPFYTIDAADVSDEGTYFVMINDVCGSTAASSNVFVDVLAPAAITRDVPTSLHVCENADVTLSVVTTGDGLRHQWRKDGVDIPDATDATYIILNASVAANGSYDVVVSGPCGSEVISGICDVSIPAKPRIVQQPSNLAVCVGATDVLRVEAEGTDLTYQWFRNGEAIDGAIGSSLELVDYTYDMNGQYHCVVMSQSPTLEQCDLSARSATVSVVGVRAPSIASHPTSQDACVGSALTLTVAVDGFDLQYQWYRNGAAIDGATQHTLTIPNLTTNDAGIYHVVATGSCGLRATSQEATIRPVYKPAIITQPRSQNIDAGQTLTLSIVATDLREVEWYHNGRRIQGASASTLTIEGAAPSNAGAYYAIVRNVCGATLSVTARVNVKDPNSTGPELTLRESFIDLGDVPVGNARTIDVVDLVENTGSANLVVTSLSLSGAGMTLVNAPSTPFTLQPGQRTSVAIRVLSNDVAELDAKLTIVSNVEGPDAVVDLAASSVRFYTHTPSLDYQTIGVGGTKDMCVTMTNDTDDEVVIDQASITGTGAAFYALQSSLPMTIPANGTADLCVRFSSTVVGQHVATIDLQSAEGGNSSVFLTGIITTATSVDEDAVATVSAYPNPMVDGITFEAERAIESVTIADPSGRIVATLTSASDVHQVRWNGVTSTGVTAVSGVYTAIVRGQGLVSTIPFTILR